MGLEVRLDSRANYKGAQGRRDDHRRGVHGADHEIATAGTRTQNFNAVPNSGAERDPWKDLEPSDDGKTSF